MNTKGVEDGTVAPAPRREICQCGKPLMPREHVMEEDDWNCRNRVVQPTPIKLTPLATNDSIYAHGCEGCNKPIYLGKYGYSHCDTTLNVECDARPRPSHPSVPKAKGVEDGMSDEQAVRQVYPDALTAYHGQFGETEVWSTPRGGEFLGSAVGRWGSEPAAWANARIKLPKPQPAVPVEERIPLIIAWQYLQKIMNSDKSREDVAYAAQCAIEQVQASYEPEYIAAAPAPAPIPEERTAEMGLLKEIINGGYLDRFPEQKKRVLDHIEGKAK